MHSTARLLIFTPTWIDPETGEDAIHAECEQAIKAQTGIEFDWHVTADNPFPVPDHRNVLHQYQQAREWFLHGSWEALLCVEHDNVLPDSGAVQRLFETPGDIVYAPYKLRHGIKPISSWQYINDRNLGMPLSNYPHELRRARQANVWRVSGAGFGCTLMRRHVLQAIEFTGATQRDKNHCPDLRFAETALRLHYLSNARFDVPVMHWDGQAWLHPYQDRRRNKMAMYLPLETMNAMAAGRFVRLIKDDPINLTDEEAADLQRIGAITAMPVVDPPPAISPEVMMPPGVDEVQSATPRKRARQMPDKSTRA